MKKLLVSSFLAALLCSNTFAEDVNTYEYAALKDANSVKSGLTSSGFSVVGEYDANAKKITSALTAAFGTLSGSKDALDDDDIEGYHFMLGMPYYEDMIEVAKGKDLLQKLKKMLAIILSSR